MKTRAPTRVQRGGSHGQGKPSWSDFGETLLTFIGMLVLKIVFCLVVRQIYRYLLPFIDRLRKRFRRKVKDDSGNPNIFDSTTSTAPGTESRSPSSSTRLSTEQVQRLRRQQSMSVPSRHSKANNTEKYNADDDIGKAKELLNKIRERKMQRRKEKIQN